MTNSRERENKSREEMYSIARRIIENDYIVIDNHTNKPLAYKPIGLLLKRNGQIGLLTNFTGTYCLNEVYVDNDGQVHLSKTSIGGNIKGSKDFNVEEYNESCMFEGGHIIDVVYLKDCNRWF